MKEYMPDCTKEESPLSLTSTAFTMVATSHGVAKMDWMKLTMNDMTSISKAVPPHVLHPRPNPRLME
ncbi:hypothetical protein ELE53_28845 [Klebsiella pneumoniae]|nr:hypothetical protein [Klebsiella pneumoniae]